MFDSSNDIRFWLRTLTRLSNLLGPSKVAINMDSSSVRPIKPFNATRNTKRPFRSCQQYKELKIIKKNYNSETKLVKLTINKSVKVSVTVLSS